MYIDTKVLLYTDWLVIAKAASEALRMGLQAKDLTDEIIQQIEKGAEAYEENRKVDRTSKSISR